MYSYLYFSHLQHRDFPLTIRSHRPQCVFCSVEFHLRAKCITDQTLGRSDHTVVLFSKQRSLAHIHFLYTTPNLDQHLTDGDFLTNLNQRSTTMVQGS
ncbi:hypothetical protein HYC85_021685 [Camellia sinensis]|uniref:Uncharacterized protein n=1 Tax=Camellia sinensis TaxID=4442 RepID=A0A7J7GMA6_CAMSI|nr:hypothetical protein HYC85_021685 [Camellia sinensis]